MVLRILAILSVLAPLVAYGEPKLERITLMPAAGFISGPGDSHAFVANGHYSDGSVRDLTREAAFSIADPGLLKYSGDGLFQATAEGVTKITVTAGGL